MAVFVSAASAQQPTEPLTIQHADQMVGFETASGAVRQLQGNVVLVQHDVTIRCDQATQELATGRAQLVGNVTVTQGTLVMTMQRGEYLSSQRLARGEGNVVIRDSAAVLRAPRGIYRVDDAVAVFWGGVQFRDDTVAITADSLAYWRRRGERRAWGRVRMEFLRDQTVVVADSAYQHVGAVRRAELCGRAFLMRLDTAAADTLLLGAEYLRLEQDSAGRTVRAEGTVRLLQGSFSARADTAVLRGEEYARFVGSPVAWADSAQLTGSVIELFLRERRPLRVRGCGAATLGLVEDSSSLAPHQLLADTIALGFDRDSLRTVTGTGNVRTLYLNRTERGEPDGITRVASDSIAIALSGGRIRRVGWYRQVQSEYVPEHMVTAEERYLRGFRWMPETKPRREQLFQQAALLRQD